MAMSVLSIFKFHDGSTDTGNGNELNVGNYNEILEVEMKTIGTATVIFEATGQLDVWRPLLGVKQTVPMTIVKETDDMTTFYQFETAGLSRIRMRVSATSGDPLYIYGKILG